MSRKKNLTSEVTITELNFPNKGVGFFNEKRVIVKNTLVGQKLRVTMSKKKGNYDGRILEILEKSNIEIEPECIDFGTCGGCTYQNIPYHEELKIKEKMVLELLSNGDIKDFKYLGIESSKSPQGYRNKIEFSFGDEEKGGELALGMRKRQSFYEVVTSKNCNIIDSDYKKILLEVLKFFKNSNESFYHKSTHTGTLRNLVIRKGYFTGEILINLITTSNFCTDLSPLLDKLLNIPLDGKIVGFLQTENNSVADVVKNDKMILIYGQNYFHDKLLGLKFKISPFSFFQTNSQGAEQLYTTVKQFLETSENKIVFDLYCGTGTIAQIISDNAKEIVGVEIVPEAIDAANENAKLNNISNCKFIAGDVLKVIDELKVKPDILILDPPRDGINLKVIKKLIKFRAEKIIYISCKPTSLVRDLGIFMEFGYKTEAVKLHDLFSRTYHVETICLMTRVNSN